MRTSWSPLQREVYANYLASMHQPAQSPIGVRWLGGMVPVPYIRTVHCAHCGARWMCDRAAWAERWESGLHADAEQAFTDDCAADDTMAQRYLTDATAPPPEPATGGYPSRNKISPASGTTRVSRSCAQPAGSTSAGSR